MSTTARAAAAKAEARLSLAISTIERKLADAPLPDDLTGLSPGEIISRSADLPTYFDVRNRARQVQAELKQAEQSARKVLDNAREAGLRLHNIVTHIALGTTIDGIDPAMAFAAATVRRAFQAGVMASPSGEVARRQA